MKQPEFWYRPPGLASWLLSPLGCLYVQALKYRLKHGQRYQASIPIISIGNINIGGTGKTPAAIAIAKRLLSIGEHPSFITRGYGGTERGPVKIELTQHQSAMVGDEPLLLAATAPTWVAHNRAAGVNLAALEGATVAVLDDAHQNSTIRHDFSIIVVDAERGFGNGKILPAGPLRESISTGLSRADVLLLIGNNPARLKFLEQWKAKIDLPIVLADTRVVATGAKWEGMRVVAFAGIAHPEKFFKTLNNLGCDLVDTIALSDHAPINDHLMQRLAAAATNASAFLVTTEKDAVRLSANWRTQVLTLPIQLNINNWEVIEHHLQKMISVYQRN